MGSASVGAGDTGNPSKHIRRSRGMRRDEKRSQQQEGRQGKEISQTDKRRQVQASVQTFITFLADVCELSVHEQETLYTIANRLIGEPVTASANQVGRTIVQAPEQEHLTAREYEVLSWLMREERVEDIAEALGITINTLRTHMGNIYAKLGVSSRGEAVLLARSNGILTQSD